MGPEQWAMYIADRLKERFQESLDQVSPYDIAYALMDFVDELGMRKPENP